MSLPQSAINNGFILGLNCDLAPDTTAPDPEPSIWSEKYTVLMTSKGISRGRTCQEFVIPHSSLHHMHVIESLVAVARATK